MPIKPMNRRILFPTLGLLSAFSFQAPAAETKRIYLSGQGPKDAVPWEFSVTKGRRAGEKTTIPVPSNWEQHGFGTYNYGESPMGKADEHGLYRTRFTVPADWKDLRVRVVFDGVMTDADVKVNGKSAGPVHQGGFYRFSHDVTKLLKPLGEENVLDVDVSKVSADALTERAERGGDYWVFGGIFRPVFLEAVPSRSIEQVSIKAGADGKFEARVELGNVREGGEIEARILTMDGQPAGEPFSAEIPGGGTARILLATTIANPELWTAEAPRLYQVRVDLKLYGGVTHTVTRRFGFRTIEARKGEGFFVNGKRVLFKGVNRHSFRPDTARALDREDCYDDVRLIKSMNMNSVRMSHYPPDVAFLEACDELGLYVIDELSGWQAAHGTQVGRRLIREMITRDVNHPSIVFWTNGNEGGWNRELDGDFALYDPQDRLVLHPWEVFNGVDTKHYPPYDDLVKRLAGPHLVMPTEVIHALYDGGAGSGLQDYWDAISKSPVGGGAFIWVFADEGIKRTDQDGRIDVNSTFAPDGIVGPRHEKKGSYYTVREIFSPVQIEEPEVFSGNLAVSNHYSFTNLSKCRFHWSLLAFPESGDPEIAATGEIPSLDIAPGAKGKLTLPDGWQNADAVSLTATGPDGQEIWTWTWPTAERLAIPPAASNGDGAPAEAEVVLQAGAVTATFDGETGFLKSLGRDGAAIPLTHGPRLVFARPAKGEPAWAELEISEGGVWTSDSPQMMNLLDIELNYGNRVNFGGFKLEISPDGEKWKMLYDATRRTSDGNRYEFPPQPVAAVRISEMRQSDGNPGSLKRVRAAWQAERFPAESGVPAKVTRGANWLERAAADGEIGFRWELADDGALRLNWSYPLDGRVTYHGVTFDHPEESIARMKWLGNGPNRVWQNRLRGTTLGVHEIARNDIQPGESWEFPEFQGMFAGLRWARFAADPLSWTVTAASPSTYLRVGTPRISHPFTTVAFPAGDISFLREIPAMGSKFITPEKTGPASQPAEVSGRHSGTVVFRIGG